MCSVCQEERKEVKSDGKEVKSTTIGDVQEVHAEEMTMRQDLGWKTEEMYDGIAVPVAEKALEDIAELHVSTEYSPSKPLHPQLSHLSSFDGEDNDRLDEGLQSLDVTVGDNSQIHATTSGSSAERSTAASCQDEIFDINKVPHHVKFHVIEQFRSILGGREIAVVTGGAPTSEAVKNFIMTCFGGIPSEGYGATEVCLKLQPSYLHIHVLGNKSISQLRQACYIHAQMFLVIIDMVS